MVAVNGIYKLAVIGTVNGQQHIHTLHFRSTAAGGAVGLTEPAFMQDLVTVWKGTPAAAYRAMFKDTFNPVQLFQVRKVCGSLPLPAGLDQAQTPGQTAGTGAGLPFTDDPLAPWLAQVVTERTALAGRRNRGRFFLGGLQEGQVTGAAILGPRITLVQNYVDALAAAFVTPLETAKNQAQFVFSRTQAAVPLVECQNAGADVVTMQVRDQLATMKSRKAGSGI